MSSRLIKTYDTVSFKNTFLEKNPILEKQFNQNFENYFCLKVEDFLDFMKTDIPPIRQKSFTIIYSTKGSHQTKIGLHEITSKPNSMVVIPNGQIFSAQNFSEDFQGFGLHFNPDFVLGKNIFKNFTFQELWSYPFIELKQEHIPTIHFLFEKLNQLYLENSKDYDDLVKSYITTILLEIQKIYELEKIQEKVPLLVNQFLKKLNENFREIKSPSVYAEILNISPNHLNKTVVNYTGKSISKWIEEVVINEAKYLLFQTNQSLGEIALELGYEDQSYFTRFFKKSEKITPVQYRKMIELS